MFSFGATVSARTPDQLVSADETIVAKAQWVSLSGVMASRRVKSVSCESLIGSVGVRA